LSAKSPSAAKSRSSSAARGEAAPTPGDRGRRWAWRLGALLFLAAAFAFGVLEVHSDTDTWISLAVGRQIIEDYHFPQGFPKNFPTVDKFSYTFYDQPFFNQNWLSHVYFWLLHDRLGPDWVVYGTWAAAWWMFIGVLLSVRLRCGSWWAGVLAAGVVAVASRDWLSARPATIQFACMSTLWLCFSALLGQGERRRWWPIGVLFVLFLLWTHAHGSFVFGFLMTGLFIGCALLVRVLALAGVWRRPVAISDGQLIALIVVALITGVLGAVLSPYGLENYTHPLKVAESPLFREIGEWQPPYMPGRSFPPVLRFWLTLGLAVLATLAVPALFFWSAQLTGHAAGWSAPARREWQRWASVFGTAVWLAAVLLVTGFFITHPVARWGLAAVLCVPLLLKILRMSASGAAVSAGMSPGGNRPTGPAGITADAALFDVLSLAIGLYMVLFARRFAPIFYIAAAPTLALGVWRTAVYLPLPSRRLARDVVSALAWFGAAGVGYSALRLARYELYERYLDRPGLTLLDRVSRIDMTVQDAIEFLQRNGIRANIFSEWTQAGLLMFRVPGTKVFIDGRSQQVYSAEHYERYWNLAGRSTEAEKNPAVVTLLLAQTETELVLTRRSLTMSAIVKAVATSPEWGLVFAAPGEMVFARISSPVYQDLAARERAGQLWWPDQPYATVARGALWTQMTPPDLERALSLGLAALEVTPMCGSEAYALVVTVLVRQQRYDDALTFLDQERERVARTWGLSPDILQLLNNELQRCKDAVMQFRARQRPPNT
jgi:hypothetical protein